MSRAVGLETYLLSFGLGCFKLIFVKALPFPGSKNCESRISNHETHYRGNHGSDWGYLWDSFAGGAETEFCGNPFSGQPMG
jgi:hypothetical protein